MIELLVVIAVIGIIAAIAIPNIGNLTAGADIAKDRRNAQNLASVFSAARASGYDASAATDVIAVGLITGDAPITANEATFHVPNLSDADIGTALNYLEISNETPDPTKSQLVYNKGE